MQEILIKYEKKRNGVYEHCVIEISTDDVLQAYMYLDTIKESDFGAVALHSCYGHRYIGNIWLHNYDKVKFEKTAIVMTEYGWD